MSRKMKYHRLYTCLDLNEIYDCQGVISNAESHGVTIHDRVNALRAVKAYADRNLFEPDGETKDHEKGWYGARWIACLSDKYLTLKLKKDVDAFLKKEALVKKTANCEEWESCIGLMGKEEINAIDCYDLGDSNNESGPTEGKQKENEQSLSPAAPPFKKKKSPYGQFLGWGWFVKKRSLNVAIYSGLAFLITVCATAIMPEDFWQWIHNFETKGFSWAAKDLSNREEQPSDKQWFERAWVSYKEQKFQESRAYLAEIKNEKWSSQIAYVLGLIAIKESSLEEAQAYLEEALVGFEEAGLPQSAQKAKLELAGIDVYRGKFESAEVKLNQIIKSISGDLEKEDYRILGIAWRRLAISKVFKDNFHMAEIDVNRSYEAFVGTESDLEIADARSIQAFIYLWNGKIDQGVAFAEEAESTYIRLGAENRIHTNKINQVLLDKLEGRETDPRLLKRSKNADIGLLSEKLWALMEGKFND